LLTGERRHGRETSATPPELPVVSRLTMHKKVVFSISAIAGAVAVGIGLATAEPASTTKALPAASQKQVQQAQALMDSLTHNSVHVVKALQGPDGMVAIEAETNHKEPNGKVGKAFAWMTPNGKGLIPVAAPLVGPHKTNWTQRALLSMGMIQKPIPAAKVAHWIAHRARTFVLGNKGPIVDAFLDPNCIFCHEFYDSAMPLVKSGKLRLRVTLVGFLKPSSAGKAAAILSAKNPVKALAYNEAHFNVQTEEGGIKPISHPMPAITGVVGANTGILSRTGALATPTVVYCKGNGQYAMDHGLPGYSTKAIEKMLRGIGSIESNGSCTK